MAANTIITSIVTGGTNNHTTVAAEANVISTDFVTQGVVGAITLNTGSGGTGSFCVNADASPDMGVTVIAGQAYISATPTGQDAQILRARASANYTSYTINANTSGSTKYDWIYLSVSATNANTPSAAADNVTSIYTSRSSSNTTDNGAPPTYGLLLAIVTVANGASSITNSNITDKRYNTSIGAQNGSLIVTQQSTGLDAIIQTAGTDANINLRLNSKGTGVVEIGENGSAVAQINAVGTDSNIPLNLVSKGTSAVQINGNRSWSYLGSATKTSNFSGTTTTADQDVGLAVTVTVPAAATTIRIMVCTYNCFTSSATGSNLELKIKEGSTQLADALVTATQNAGYPLCPLYVGTATAGAHTYKVSIATAGAGAPTMGAGSTAPATLIVDCC